MSWIAAGKLSRQIAERFDGVRRVSPERMEALRRQLNRVDQEALTEWLHRRLAQEFHGFAAACRMNADADVTVVERPRRKLS
jgi:hypothetical protein